MSLYCAIEADDVESLHSLLQLGTIKDLNAPTDCGNTPLYLAVAHSAEKVLRYLYQRGVDISAFCDEQKFGNALFHAIHHERLGIIRLLYILGVDLDCACDKFDHKPDAVATVMGKPHIIRLLKELKLLKDESAIKIQRIARGRMTRNRLRNGGDAEMKKEDDEAETMDPSSGTLPPTEKEEGRKGENATEGKIKKQE